MNLSRGLIPDMAVMQVFETAARHGNFTKAANELHLTQSAVSRQIGSLEVQLGVLLFERVRKRVILSKAGHELLPAVRRLLAQSEELVLRARSSADAKASLSIATMPTFAIRWLLPRLPAFLERHPGVVVNIASRAQPFDFAGEDFDLAIHYGQPVWANATCTYLCSEVIVPVASPRLVGPSGLDARELETKPLLHLATRPRLWAEWLQANGVASDHAYRGHRFDQFSMIIEATVGAMGFSLLPLYLIENEIAAGQLAIVVDRPMHTDNSYYVVVPEGKPEGPLENAFRSWILKQVGSRPASLPGQA